MKLLFPQATHTFNDFFIEMMNQSLINSFLDQAFESYEMDNIDEVVMVLLENPVVENFLNAYLKNSTLISKFKLIVLKKETSGSICTSLMAISHLKNEPVIISALDQLFLDKIIKHTELISENSSFDIIAPIHYSDDDTLSYALKDEDHNVIQLFEKKVVSNDALLGVYLIKNFSDFLKHCHDLLIKYKGFKNRVFFTSDVINSFIAKSYVCHFPSLNVRYNKIRSLKDFKNIYG
ncbi:hypothetical protein N9W24_01080 [Gammaproteobacteria bacterium]|nr:hypothetical protein [Gammaproteobacteria bacterium]